MERNYTVCFVHVIVVVRRGEEANRVRFSSSVGNNKAISQRAALSVDSSPSV